MLVLSVLSVFLFYLFSSTSKILVESKVQFEISPETKRFPGNRNLLDNSDVLVTLKCWAAYPTQWSLNDEQNSSYSIRNEWMEREGCDYTYQIGCSYTAWVRFKQRFTTSLTLRCEATQDYGDAIEVTLVPSHDTLEVLQKYVSSNPVQYIAVCAFNLDIIYVDGYGYYGLCTQNGTVRGITTTNYQCNLVSSACASKFRDVKNLKNVCTKHISESHHHMKIQQAWTKLFWSISGLGDVILPGTIVCSDRSDQKPLGAQEYFFTPPDATGKRDIHFSRDEIHPSEMLSLTLDNPRTTYYTVNDHITGNCTVPYYSFSDNPMLILKKNNTVLFSEDIHTNRNIKDNRNVGWTFSFNFSVSEKESPFLEILCTGPVSWSTEWATKRALLIIKDPVPPSFKELTETVTFTEGDERKEIDCKANGDPQPHVEWNKDYPGTTVNGSALVFFVIKEFVEREYHCKATNLLGQVASKTFKVVVFKQDTSSTSFTVAVVAVAVCITLILLTIMGIAYFYYNSKIPQLPAVLPPNAVIQFSEVSGTIYTDVESSASYVESLAYNKTHELPMNSFCVDTTKVLGSGVYGIVYQGTVVTKEKGEVKAAFKTVKPEGQRCYLKALLAELKILIHLGHHEAIVNLIGAWTEKLGSGEIFMVVELCDCSLLNFLRKNVSSFLDYARIDSTNGDCGTTYHCILNDSKQFSTFNLIHWGKQIASGLEFIASKQIVHGDIAARNILLTFELDAKVCDFGLARQLVDYNYIKSEACPLPWKWMAVEALDKMQFSTKSDIWSFGVTLWEISTIGGIPYAGLEWSPDFIQKLQNGLCLPEPPKVPKEIWNLMVECWSLKREDRPTFTRLKDCLEQFEGTMQRREN